MTDSTSIGVLQSGVRFNGGEILGRQTTAMLRIGAGRHRSERAGGLISHNFWHQTSKRDCLKVETWLCGLAVGYYQHNVQIGVKRSLEDGVSPENQIHLLDRQGQGTLPGYICIARIPLEVRLHERRPKIFEYPNVSPNISVMSYPPSLVNLRI